jgi:hypothetical protein
VLTEAMGSLQKTNQLLLESNKQLRFDYTEFRSRRTSTGTSTRAASRASPRLEITSPIRELTVKEAMERQDLKAHSALEAALEANRHLRLTQAGLVTSQPSDSLRIEHNLNEPSFPNITFSRAMTLKAVDPTSMRSQTTYSRTSPESTIATPRYPLPPANTRKPEYPMMPEYLSFPPFLPVFGRPGDPPLPKYVPGSSSMKIPEMDLSSRRPPLSYNDRPRVNVA